MGPNEWTRGARLAPVVVGITVTFGVATAHEPSPNDLVKALQSGGYVLVMRHASSPREAPSKEVANADNTKLERQLDEAGRTGATAMGEAIRALRIPIGMVLIRTRVTEVPKSGNTILVTHQPNLSRAFPNWGSTVADGETVVLRLDGKGGITVLGRIKIDDWSRMR